jgi:hypothetical protein
MRVLTPVLERAMLAMSHPRQHLTCGGGVALELIRDDHPGHAWQPFEQLLEACLDRPLVATTLHQDVEDVIVLIHGPPQFMASAMDGQHDVAERPMVSRPDDAAADGPGIGRMCHTTDGSLRRSPLSHVCIAALRPRGRSGVSGKRARRHDYRSRVDIGDVSRWGLKYS